MATRRSAPERMIRHGGVLFCVRDVLWVPCSSDHREVAVILAELCSSVWICARRWGRCAKGRLRR